MDLGLARRRALLIGNHRAILEACAAALLAEGAAVAAARVGGQAIEGAAPLEPSLGESLALADAARTMLGGVDIVVSAFEFDGGALASDGSEQRLIQGWDELTAMATLYQTLARDMARSGFGRLIWAGPTEAKVLTGRRAEIDTVVGIGALGLHKTLSGELGPHGITVNSVLWDEDAGGPEAVAQAVAASVAFFASEPAAYLTGCVVAVDAGLNPGVF